MRGRKNSAPPISLFSFQDIITSVIGIMVLLLMVLAIELVSRKQGPPTTGIEPEITKLREQIEELDRQLAAAPKTSASEAQALATLSEGNILQQRQVAEEVIDRLRREQEENQRRLATATDAANDAARAADSQRVSSTTEAAKLAASVADLEQRKAELASGRLLIFNPQRVDKIPWLTEVSEGSLVLARPDELHRPRKISGTSSSDLLRGLKDFARTRNARSEYFVLLLKPSAVGPHQEIEKAVRSQGFDLGWELIGEHQTVMRAEPVEGVSP